ncbi:DUF6416 domain-containing protein [Actinomadura kijaniata]|uniref:DUF6416 domain-containing protein n=1 Tax=Actinomadura kijaniata TaxID=46161 RepID=UPI000831E474|nr:DUF6416 domain-containing protein [Actinomadura kijaniata]
MMDVTVKVPEERLAEFYAMYARWLAGPEAREEAEGSGGRELAEWTAADVDLAEEVWEKFSGTAKTLFSVLIDEPERRFTGDELARMLHIEKGRHGIAGVLGWPGRHCAAVGRHYCWYWEHGDDGAPVMYWMTDEVAGLFGRVRDRNG